MAGFGRQERQRLLLIDVPDRVAPALERALGADYEVSRLGDLAELSRAGAGSGLLIAGAHPDEDVSQLAGRLQACGWRGAWLLAASGADPERNASAHAAGAAAVIWADLDASRLRRAVDRAAEQGRLRRRVGRLEDRIQTMEDCRPLLRCLEPGQLFPMALDLLLQTSGRSRGLALFKRDAVPHNDSVAVRGFSEDEAAAISRVLLDEGKPLDQSGYEQIEVLDRGALHEAFRRADLEVGQLLVLPFHAAGARPALICVLEDGEPFGPGDRERSEILTGAADTALHNAQTYALAKDRAFIDDVTEVYNARYLLQTCENEIQRAERYGNPLSVLFLDLDRFKTVNDRFGHLIGSDTLRRLSQLLGQCVRQVDTLARYGGDEFTIVLVDTAHDEAMRIAERIRHTVETHPFEVGPDDRLHLTISIGVATCPAHGESRDPLLEAADKAMYRAKSEGRNRVCSATELS
jgi:diguanylate cyclase (GGDEF)-like protein